MSEVIMFAYLYDSDEENLEHNCAGIYFHGDLENYVDEKYSSEYSSGVFDLCKSNVNMKELDDGIHLCYYKNKQCLLFLWTNLLYSKKEGLVIYTWDVDALEYVIDKYVRRSIV